MLNNPLPWAMRRVLLLATIVLSAIAPASLLHAQCNTPTAIAGEIIFNTTVNAAQFCDGTNWINLNLPSPTAPNTGCSSPSGLRGEVIFNQVRRVHQACNGSQWADMACASEAAVGTGCTNPAAVTGTLLRVTQGSITAVLGCSGTRWQQLGVLCGNNPDVFSFATVNNSMINTNHTTSATMAGFVDPLNATVTLGTAQIRRNNTGAWGTTVQVSPGDQLNVSMTSAGTFGASVASTIQVGSIAATWTINNGTVSYGAWGSWGSCSVTCGGGTQTRTRTCNFSGGGTVACSHCGGQCSQNQSCNTQSCCVSNIGEACFNGCIQCQVACDGSCSVNCFYWCGQ